MKTILITVGLSFIGSLVRVFLINETEHHVTNNKKEWLGGAA